MSEFLIKTSDEDLGLGMSESDIIRLSIHIWKKNPVDRKILQTWRQAVSHGWETYRHLEKTFDPQKGKIQTFFCSSFIFRMYKEKCANSFVKISQYRYDKGERAVTVNFCINMHDRIQAITDNWTEEKEILNKYITTLPDRDQYIICHRYGINGADIMTIQQIANYYGCCFQNIQQIEKRIIRQMKSNIRR